MCHYIVFIFLQHRRQIDLEFSSLTYSTMSYKLWGGYFFPPHAPIYGAGDVSDENPSIHMSSIQNDIDTYNIIFLSLPWAMASGEKARLVDKVIYYLSLIT